MRIDIKKYIAESRIKIEEGISIEDLLSYLRKEGLPPGFCKMIFIEIFKISHDEADDIVFNSGTYKDMGKNRNLFFDLYFNKLKKDDGDPPSSEG